MKALTEKERNILDVLKVFGRPDGGMTTADVAQALGADGYNAIERTRKSLRLLELAGLVAKSGNYHKLYTLVPKQGERELVEMQIPTVQDGFSNEEIADEIEAEKVWRVAALIRSSNTAWGVDEGIDADVREARALMAEARRQVRENSPVGEHHRSGDTYEGAE